MDRRHFLTLAASTLAAGGVSSFQVARAADGASLHQQKGDKDWSIGYQNPPAYALSTERLRIEGRLPGELVGVLYRNGPAIHERAGQRYHHWFDGDGMVQAFRIGEGFVSHRGRVIATEKFQQEERAGRFLLSAFGTTIPNARSPSSAAALNTANINIMQHHGRLLALWEGGDAYNLDPVTLESQGPLHWSAETAGLPFTAHPRVTPDGVLWAFGAVPWAKRLVFYKISPTGNLMRSAVAPMDPPAMVHDFLITDRYLIFLLPSFHFDLDRAREGTMLEAYYFQPNQPMRLLIYDKNDFAKVAEVELPAGMVFHFGNAWEDGETVRFDVYIYPDANVIERSLRDVMRGEIETTRGARLSLIAFNLRTKRIEIENIAEAVEFPQADPRHVGQRQDLRITLGRSSYAVLPGFDEVRRFDLTRGEIERYRYGANIIAEEHVFVPSSAGAGWVIGTSLDIKARATRLAILAADRLRDGPVAMAHLPYALPLGLHGCFVGSA